MSTPRAPRPRTSQVSKAAQAGEGNRKVWLIAGVVAVIAFAAIIAVALSQEEGSPEETAEVTVEGDALSVYDPEADEAVGQPAPELSGTSLDGDAISIENDGRPKLIGFFAHWCQFCQAEVPVVSEWVNAGGLPDDVDFYGVSTSVNPARGNYPPSNWFEEEGWEVPTLRDDAASSAHIAYGAGPFPFWAVVDADGNVVARESGQIGVDRIEQLLEQARTGAG